jgi:transcriptional regulator with XRE-family HTH domain
MSSLSQKELADKLFVSQQVISDYERDKRQPSIDRVKEIAKVTGIDPAFFFFGELRFSIRKLDNNQQ